MKINGGDKRKEQFEEIYKMYKNSILRTCYMILKDYQLAEDATQDVFVRVYCKLNTFKAKSDIKTWITRIAINVCKSKMRTRAYSETINSETVIVHSQNKDEHKTENKLIISESVMRLPKDLREVTVLFYYQELKQKEIAKMLKIPETTVAYRLRKAKEQLKSNIKEDFLYE